MTRRAVKYIFDRIAAIVALLLMLPIFVIVWLVIKYHDKPDSVLFSQTRIGMNGKPFKIYKFRTMVQNQGSSISVLSDPRITSLGTYLRKYKLDELPELWNIFIGDMSFVGPRPDVPGYADLLQGEARKILELRPGLTGPASLKYFNEAEQFKKGIDYQEYNETVIFPDKVEINLEYYKNYNLITDIVIIFDTLLRRYDRYA